MQRRTILLARATIVIVALGILLPQTVPVCIAASLPNLTVGPTTLSFTYQIGGGIPAAQTISVASGAPGLSYMASASGEPWLTVLPVSGTTPGSVSVSILPQGLTAGVYSGDVIIQATGAGNAPQIVTVNLRVIDPTAPQLMATPSSLTFNYTIGGIAPAAQGVSIGANGSALSYTASASGGVWLAVTPASGATPGSASVFVDATGLTAGTYTGSVGIAIPGGGNTPLVVPVSLTVTASLPNLTVSPTTLSFTYQLGGAIPAAQTISVASSASGLSYTASASGGSWLTALPVSGTTPGSIGVSISPQGLTAGVYSGDVIIQATGAGNAPQIVTASLTVIDPTAPKLTATPSSLTFNYITGTPPPEAQTIAIGASGSALSYTVSASGGLWLAVAPASGATPGSASISVDPTGLTAGTYTGSLSIADTGAGNSPLIVPASLNVVTRGRPRLTTRSSLAVTAAGTVPNLTVSPMTLSFTYQIGGTIPAAQTVSPVASDGSALSYTASASGDSWLTALPVNGTTPGSVSVSISPQGLAAGVYVGHVIVASPGAANLPQWVTVSLTVTGSPAPTLTAAPASLAFSYQAGGPAPPAQALTIGSSGSVLGYTVSASGGAWLGVTPTTGNTLGSVGIFVNTSGLAVGTYSGSVSIAAAGAGNTLTVPVTLTVTLGDIFTTLYSANFYYIIGGGVQSLPNISIGSTGSALSYTVSAPSWLAVTPTSGTTPGSLGVTLNTTGLTAGTYSGSVTIAAPGAGNSPLTLPENLTVVNPSIVPSQSSLRFNYAAGGTAPAAQSLSISSNGAALSYTVSASGGTWLSVTPTSGTTPGSVSVSVNTTGLAVGTYSGSVTIAATGAANTPVTLPVTLSVTLPAITTTPSSLTFSYTIGGTAPAAQSVSITSNGSALSYTVSASGGTWLVVTPTSGTTPGSVSVSVNTTGLAAGTYSGSVTITSSGASNSPRTVTVTLTVA